MLNFMNRKYEQFGNLKNEKQEENDQFSNHVKPELKSKNDKNEK